MSGGVRPCGIKQGTVHLIECREAASAVLLGGDRRVPALATRLGDRYLAVPAEKFDRFRKAALALGHPIT